LPSIRHPNGWYMDGKSDRQGKGGSLRTALRTTSLYLEPG
jgi:hypothetical protein